MTQAPATFRGPAADWEPWIGYIRVSTWREEKISPEIQELALRSWAARSRRRLIEPLIVDLDATGRNFKRKIMGAIESVERREARGVAVWKYSRWGRNDLGIKINLARLERAGGQLASATEDFDVTTAVGKFNRNVMFDLAVFESDRAAEQWQETHAVRIAHGVPATGRGRFGYLWTPRRVPDATSPTGWRTQPEGYRLHPDYAPVCDELYERKVADYDGFESLARWLTDDLDVPRPRGDGPWNPATVNRMLDSGFAAGLLHIHDPECRCPYRTTPRGERRPSTCTEGRMMHVPGAHPAIISADRWQAYGEHREQTRRTPPRARRASYPLTGIVHHGACRSRISAASATIEGRQVRGYVMVCTTHKASRRACLLGLHVHRADVEAGVRAWLTREVEATTARATAEVTEDRLAPASHTDRTAAELRETDAALIRATANHARGLYDDDEYVATRDRLRAERDALTARLARASEAAKVPTRAAILPLAGQLSDAWNDLSPVEANAILRKIVLRVVVHELRVPGSREIGVRVEVHPAWEPDPWEPLVGEVVASSSSLPL